MALKFHAILSLTILFALPCLTTAHAVQQLSLRSIDHYISRSKEKPLLIEFYAPHCIHCRRFEPTYIQLAEQLSTSAVVARVDVSAHPTLTQRFSIRQLPSFVLIHDRKVFEFTGTRTPEILTAFVERRGEQHGKLVNSVFGPLNPYWLLVAYAFQLVDQVQHWVLRHNITPLNAAFIGVAVLFAILTLFVIFIHFATRPKIASSSASRPHTD